MNCLWCEGEFQSRASGCKPQRFCSAPCRRAFDTACRKIGAAEIEAGRLQVSEFRMARGQRARCPQCGSALRATPRASKTNGALAAPWG